MRSDSIRLSRRHKFAFYTILAVVFVSGAIWVWLHYFMHDESNFGSSPTEAWMLTIHGLFAAAALLVIGSLLPLHVKFAWRAKRNRFNGIFFISITCLLVLTGYALYYIGNERLRSLTSWTHLVIGLAFPLLLILHIWRGRASRNRRIRTHARTSENVFAR